MDKNEALKLFFRKNQINFAAASDHAGGSYDENIAGLPAQVDCWLAQIGEEDQEVFLRLLSRYTYLTRRQCQQRYEKLLSMLQARLEQAGCTLADVMFVTVESCNGFKSGGDNVRTDLKDAKRTELRNRQIVAAKSRLSLQDLAPYRFVVFLDDIVGSGITLWNEIEAFCKRFPAVCDRSLFTMLYACIVPRRHGIRHIRDNCRKYRITVDGLFDETWYEEPSVQKGSRDYLALEKYEEMVGNYMVEPGKSYFMGFQKNRLLISFYYNTPNNTLSTFWRAVPEKHVPPFRRDGDQPAGRPSVNDLKKREEAMRRSAYQFGSDYWRKIRNE